MLAFGGKHYTFSARVRLRKCDNIEILNVIAATVRSSEGVNGEVFRIAAIGGQYTDITKIPRARMVQTAIGKLSRFVTCVGLASHSHD